MMRKTSFRHAWLVGTGFLLFIGLISAPQPAAAQQQGAEGFIANLGREAIQVLGPSVSPTMRAARFRELFNADFDLPDISRFVLGRYRRALDPQQQQEFHRLFADYLAHSYAAKLAHYAGDEFRVTGSRPWEGGTLVYSQVLPRHGNPIELDWQVTDNGGRYQITDVYVDHVSMRLSQRNEFAAIVQRNGGNPVALIAALRQELAVGS